MAAPTEGAPMSEISLAASLQRRAGVKRGLLILNHSLLFLCVSIYLGTGWSMVLFSFPMARHLTPASYYYAFVPQVAAATEFFTGMTKLMIVLCIIMLVAEWKTGFRWVPIIVLLAVFAATGLTLKYIFPLNEAMTHGISDLNQLQNTLGHWMYLNRIRVSLWTVQWAAMMAYFALKITNRGATT
jgi:hypothetical protein